MHIINQILCCYTTILHQFKNNDSETNYSYILNDYKLSTISLSLNPGTNE